MGSSHLHPLTLTLSQGERGFSPFSSREKGGDEGAAGSEIVFEMAPGYISQLRLNRGSWCQVD